LKLIYIYITNDRSTGHTKNTYHPDIKK